MYKYIIPGRPVPKKTMTKNSKWSDPRAKQTLAYQQEIALRVKCRGWEGFTPDDDLILTVRVYLRNNVRGDLANYVKSCEDGLQLSGLVPNDRQIVRYGEGTGIYRCDDERMEIEIGRLP